MNETVSEVTLVFRNWNHESGLTEHAEVHPSLEALFSACLNAGDADLIDRIIIRGHDVQGHERIVTFMFQSVTISR